MRNLFDQYDAPENRLTHALACCLNEDRRLLRLFIQWITGRIPQKAAKLEVMGQQVPGQPIAACEEGRGLPDIWIVDPRDERWSLVVECKVASTVESGQLHRHRRTAARNGFDQAVILVLCPNKPPRVVSGVRYVTWTELYRWMRQRCDESEWALRFVDYIQIAEARMIANGYLTDGALTEFDGIPFDVDTPYSYREAKRVLRLMMSELRSRDDLKRLGIDPNQRGRKAITGREADSVWDFIPLKIAKRTKNFTAFPHLDVSVQKGRFIAGVTVPSRIAPRYRRNLAELGFDGFNALVSDVERRMSCVLDGIDLAYPAFEVIQRHYPSQRAQPITDARLEFDLRTAASQPQAGVKVQKQWLNATYEAFANKQSNLQLLIGAIFPYGSERLQSSEVLDTVAKVWTACEPWLQMLIGTNPD